MKWEKRARLQDFQPPIGADAQHSIDSIDCNDDNGLDRGILREL